MRIRNTSHRQKIELQMTPMIDIVFQLLVFFIMTFKTVEQEGDFNIKMPRSAPSQSVPDIDPLPPMKLSLRADGNGNLANIQLGERQFTPSIRGGQSDFAPAFAQLRAHLLSIVGDDVPSGVRENAEIEIACDFDLRYEHVIDAVSAVSGYTTADGQIVRLVEKIRFAPPRQGP